MLIESSWHFRFPLVQKSRALMQRQKSRYPSVISYADRANTRLTRKFARMRYKNKSTKTIVIAVARELSGFIWGIMTEHIA